MDDACDSAVASRPSMEKRPRPSLSAAHDDDAQSAFKRLPDEIIEQILRLTDPDSFASLILLNSNWRRISQQAHLYAYHLSRCPSYSASHNGIPSSLDKNGDDALPKLRRLFAREVKRNLFEAYLRPRTTTIKLVSNSISSSSVPGGEGMQFSSSPRGYHILAYNSSRIYVLDMRGPELVVERELKIMRRPVAACTLDDASLLAVLSSDMQVDVYDLCQHPPKRTQSLILDNPPRTIALSPCGSVLAAAYEGGIEVSSLHTGALPTDRRAVKCDGVDSLAFSFDGTQLLGTTTVAQPPNTVILTAPYYDPGSHMGENNISALWTTSILFPNTSRDCSHAVLLQESSSEEASWTFTYDSSFETFRAVRIDDLRNGTTYFTGPIPNASTQSTLVPCTLPAASYCGDLVSAGFENRDVWIYGIPEDLEAVPETTSNSSSESGVPGLNRRNSSLSVRTPSSRLQETNGGRVPQWQILCDKYRNTFVSGRKVTALEGVSTVKWVADYGTSSMQERLVVAARGVQPAKPITEEDGIDFVDGGRITILDYDYGTNDGETVDVTIEVGTQEPEALEEEHRDMDTEVAIVRRRTVAQRRGGGRSGVMRSTPLAMSQSESLLRPPVARDGDDDDPLVPRRIGVSNSQANTSTASHNEPEDATLEEAQEALDAPYAHASPRSGPTLRRAATAAAVNRRLHPSAASNGHIQYRRADGRAEHPHESDADNWVPPPPPYSKEDPGDTPAFLRAPAIPGVGLDPNAQSSTHPPAPPPASTTAPSRVPPAPPSVAPQLTSIPSHSSGNSSARMDLPRLQTSPGRERRSRLSWQSGQSQPRAASESVTRNEQQRPGGSHQRRPSSSSVRPPTRGSQFTSFDQEDIYDVSPIEPAPPPALGQTTQQRRPSESAASAASATSHTPASSNPYSAGAASCQGSATSNQSTSERRPSTSLSQMSQIQSQSQSSRAGQDPVIGRLTNSSTWPRAQPEPSQSSTAAVLGYPRSAPAVNISNREMLAAALPPLPSPNQLSALHNRQNPPAPRPVSGSFQIPRVPIGRDLQDRPPSSSRFSLQANFSSPPAPELPLIISTPTGVTGAFDTPDQVGTQTTPAEPVLHAPVPRHPRPILGVGGSNSPVAERLEGVYSTTGQQGPNGQPLMVPPPPSSSQLTSSSLRHHTSLSRRPSRARRSAAKNVQDAKTRGWAGRRRRKNAEKEPDGASSAAWTDVTWASNAPRDGKATKASKCMVM
ncbi:hypothetical protein PG990_005909 [Apiospora arundinis]